MSLAPCAFVAGLEANAQWGKHHFGQEKGKSAAMHGDVTRPDRPMGA